MTRFRIFLILFFPLFEGTCQDIQLIVPTGHTRRVTEISNSFDGQWLASADGSSVVKIWSFTGAEEVFHLRHDLSVGAVRYHPTQPYLFTSDASGQVYSWNETGGINSRLLLDVGEVIELLIHNDTLIVVGTGGVAMVDWHDPRVIRNIEVAFEGISAATLKDDQLVVANSAGSVQLVPLLDGESRTVEVSESKIASIAPGGSGMVYLGTDRGELIALDIATMKTQTIQAFSLRNYQMAYDEPGNLIFACGRDDKENLKVFDSRTLEVIKRPFELKAERESEAFAFGLRAISLVQDSLLLIADYQQDIQCYNLRTNRWTDRFTGKAGAVYDLSMDRSGKWLALATSHDRVKVIDMTGTGADRVLAASSVGSRAVDFHPVNPVVAVYGLDERIRVTNILNGNLIFELKAKGEYSSTPINFDPSGKYILRKSSESDFDFYNFKTQSPKNLKVKNGREYVFSPDGRQLIFSTSDGLSIYDAAKHQKIRDIPLSNVQDLAMSNSGKLAVLLRDDLTVVLFDEKQQQIGTTTLQSEGKSDQLFWTPDGKYLIGVRNSVSRGEGVPDFSIKMIDSGDGTLVKVLPGHSGFATDLEFINGRMLTSGIDGLVRIWDLSSAESLIGTLIPMDSDQYVVTTDKGLYDATSKAMKELHYIKSGKVIALEQLKDAYYEPKLLSKLLGFNEEPIREAEAISGISLYPELQLQHPLKNDGKLGINLTSNGGGIGRVVILINGKEVSSDVRSAANQKSNAVEINYDLKDHPFLFTDRVSKVTIMAYNEDGTLSTDSKSLYVFADNEKEEPPELFAIFAGSSNYAGDDLDLKFAAKDAADLASAIELSACSYLGVESTHITLLTTDQDTSLWPTKAHIENAFKEYSQRASANDLLLVYLSGHGVNKGGEHSDFYYLTSTAKDGDMNNTIQREQSAISSMEFTTMINSVPALKQILIIDACHSGRLASSLVSSRSAMSSTQIRALERMKDRTGMYVLAGSAADAVSYETTLYGQGLLTYSLLFGLKGAALREDGFVDVMDLFQFATNKVPELAEGIGGIQKPEIRIPAEGKSFDIGRLTVEEQAKIRIKAPKAAYVHSRFQEETLIYDPLHISDLMDEKLSELSSEKEAPIVFVDDKSFSSGIVINGRYKRADVLIEAQISLVRDGVELSVFMLEAMNEDELTEQILQKALELDLVIDK